MIKKILLPLDGSAFAEKAIPYAQELAQKFDAEIILLWVLHPLIIMSDYGSHAYDKIIHLEEQEAKSYLLEQEIALCEADLKVNTQIFDGQTAQAILEVAAEEYVDAIVMTTHGRSGIERWIHGSVATKVLRHAPCPVCLVRVKASDCPE